MLSTTSIWTYAWSALTLFFIVGIACYLLDRKVGVHVYQWQYDLRHSEAKRVPTDKEYGFLYNQSTNRQVTVAYFLATCMSLYMGIWELKWSVNLLAEIVIWLLEAPALLIGFKLGKFVYRAMLKRTVYFDKADKLSEQLSELDVGGIAKKAGDIGGSFVDDMFAKGRSIFKGPPRAFRMDSAQATSPPKVEPTPPEPEEDPREVIKRFTRR